jgi:hypothetical protein
MTGGHPFPELQKSSGSFPRLVEKFFDKLGILPSFLANK